MFKKFAEGWKGLKKLQNIPKKILTQVSKKIQNIKINQKPPNPKHPGNLQHSEKTKSKNNWNRGE